MDILITTVVCLLAGLGAGLGTGFAGMSAAAVITPMLVTFLGIEPYTAVGIALASDVLASAVSAYTYGKNKNLDIKNGLVMMITVLVFTVVGSFISSLVPSVAMGNFSVFMTLILGIKFIVKPGHDNQRRHGGKIHKIKNDKINNLRCDSRLYLWIYRRRRRNDDASSAYKRYGL